VPSLGALVAEPLYILADTAVVGRLGTEQLAGLAIASSALLTGYAVFIVLAYGTTAAVSRLLGAGRPDAAAREAVQSLWLALAIGVVVASAMALVAEPLVGALGADGPVRAPATTYLRVSLAGVPFQLLVFAGTGYLRGLQDTRTPLRVAVVAAAANLVIELVLINGLGFGIGASALSTVIAQVGSAAVYAAIVLRATSRLGAPLRPDLRAIGRIARVGWDLVIRTVALRGALLVATAVAARIGTAELAAHEIAFALWNLLALALDALAIAGQSLIGLHLGAGAVDRAVEAGRRMLQLGVVGGVLLGLLVLLARPLLPGLFTTDDAVRGIAGSLLVWVAVLQPLGGVVFVLDGLLIGAGDMAFLARAMVVAALAFAVPAVGVLVLGLGIGWLWAAIGVLLVARASILGWRWRGTAWARVGAG
jgi:putative MATE family efflux protein